jgi:hypothetical protein
MSFLEADEFNGVHGNQFIADLMPKHTIYTALISETARAVMGVPNHSGRAAMRMLEDENFAFENYIDIFDGGPTMIARTDAIRTVAGAVASPVVEIRSIEAEPQILAKGRLAQFPDLRRDDRAAGWRGGDQPGGGRTAPGAGRRHRAPRITLRGHAARDQLRRDHRARATIIRARARAISRPAAMRARSRIRGEQRSRGWRRCAPICGSA